MGFLCWFLTTLFGDWVDLKKIEIEKREYEQIVTNFNVTVLCYGPFQETRGLSIVNNWKSLIWGIKQIVYTINSYNVNCVICMFSNKRYLKVSTYNYFLL